MTVTITAFERSPDGGQGLARDTRAIGCSNSPLAWARPTGSTARSARVT